ncbi:hypothetical protein BV20DRAFT_953672 [Pilatotrama ljubarskyi]|nr:hypothetical protein BV20DRAFT_953672 [Pilatotrama ljubarskyi]
MSPGPSADPSASSPTPSTAPQAKLSTSDSSDDDRKPRTLILCFDGTNEQYDGNNTNVVKFYSLLKKDDDNDQQLCYYQPGVGTYLNPGVVSPLFQWGAKLLDEAFAWRVELGLRARYQFLMQNYNAGDKICLFGFSRGAYTARALAGMLHKIGLLPKDNPEQIPFAYKLYTKTDKDSLAMAAGFKQTFCRTIEIEFVGVWETVSSVGVLMSRTLPFTTANMTIKRFRHALSLDEHRVKFLPNFYHRAPTSSDVRFSVFDSQQSDETRQELAPGVPPATADSEPGKASKTTRRGWFGKFARSPANVEKAKLHQNKARLLRRKGHSPTQSSTSSLVAEAQGDRIPGGTDVQEVWFAGCHGDVGGGAVDDDVVVSLSDITLRWMVREVVLAQCGIAFDEAALVRANIPESIFRGTGFPLPAQTTISGSDPLDTSADALQPIHDALKTSPMWWLVEIVPTWWQWQKPDGTWKTTFWWHLGRGRQVPLDVQPKFHVTVRERMQDPNLKYTPKAQWKAGTEVYVD